LLFPRFLTAAQLDRRLAASTRNTTAVHVSTSNSLHAYCSPQLLRHCTALFTLADIY
jgi:hypothetical protein